MKLLHPLSASIIIGMTIVSCTDSQPSADSTTAAIIDNTSSDFLYVNLQRAPAELQIDRIASSWIATSITTFFGQEVTYKTKDGQIIKPFDFDSELYVFNNISAENIKRLPGRIALPQENYQFKGMTKYQLKRSDDSNYQVSVGAYDSRHYSEGSDVAASQQYCAATYTDHVLQDDQIIATITRTKDGWFDATKSEDSSFCNNRLKELANQGSYNYKTLRCLPGASCDWNHSIERPIIKDMDSTSYRVFAYRDVHGLFSIISRVTDYNGETPSSLDLSENIALIDHSLLNRTKSAGEYTISIESFEKNALVFARNTHSESKKRIYVGYSDQRMIPYGADASAVGPYQYCGYTYSHDLKMDEKKVGTIKRNVGKFFPITSDANFCQTMISKLEQTNPEVVDEWNQGFTTDENGTIKVVGQFDDGSITLCQNPDELCDITYADEFNSNGALVRNGKIEFK